MTIRQALQISESQLKHSQTYPLAAQALLAEVLQIEPIALAQLSPEQALSHDQQSDLEARLQRLLEGEPLDYVLGFSMFWGQRIKVTHDVLIPRPETEQLVELVTKSGLFQKGCSLLEVGTGSGCVSVTLIQESKKRNLIGFSLTGIDKSTAALDITRQNIQDLTDTPLTKSDQNTDYSSSDGSIRLINIGIENLANEAELNPRIIVSNPPYLTSREIQELDPSVGEHEPLMALAAGEDGLAVYQGIAAYIKTLKSIPELYLEISPATADGVNELFSEIYQDVTLHEDLFGRIRFLSAISGRQ